MDRKTATTLAVVSRVGCIVYYLGLLDMFVPLVTTGMMD